jgi:hypothetical protein
MPPDHARRYLYRRQGGVRPADPDWLRERVHAACPEVEESIKWSMPAFIYKGKPLAMAAFKAHATFGFWDRQALATGKEGEAMGQFGRIDFARRPAFGAAIFEAQVREAVARIDAGQKPQARRSAPKPEAEVPAELAEALAGDAKAAATFTGFPPSCRREYCEWIAEAKRPETKAKRVEEAVAWMREGKRRNWKYENC